MAASVDGRAPAPRWAAPLTLGLSAIGTAIASYLTYAHFTTASVLSCPDTGTVNCVKVTTSEQSHILGIPVAVLGLAYFVAMLGLMSPHAWRARQRWWDGLRLLATLAGVGMVVWLVYAELFLIEAICLYCTAVHVVTFLLFAAVVTATALRSGPSTAGEWDDLSDDMPDDVPDDISADVSAEVQAGWDDSGEPDGYDPAPRAAH